MCLCFSVLKGSFFLCFVSLPHGAISKELKMHCFHRHFAFLVDGDVLLVA